MSEPIFLNLYERQTLELLPLAWTSLRPDRREACLRLVACGLAALEPSLNGHMARLTEEGRAWLRHAAPRSPHIVLPECRGEACRICGVQAHHKVGEEILASDPEPARHNLTAYLCCTCFQATVGRPTPWCGLDPAAHAEQQAAAAAIADLKSRLMKAHWGLLHALDFNAATPEALAIKNQVRNALRESGFQGDLGTVDAPLPEPQAEGGEWSPCPRCGERQRTTAPGGLHGWICASCGHFVRADQGVTGGER